MSKAETEANAIKIAEFFLLASALINDEPNEDEDNLLYLDDRSNFDQAADNAVEVMKLVSIDWLRIAEAIHGDGTQRLYDQIPKPADYISISLHAPDCYFQQMFWFVQAFLFLWLSLTLFFILRVGWDMFSCLINLLSHDPSF